MMKELTVLLVEDNESDILLTTLVLNKAGIENGIYLARDGEEAIDYLTKKNQFENATTPDVVFLDINMPKVSGLQVLFFIKNKMIGKLIPLIIYTSSNLESDIRFCIENRVDLFLNKPTMILDFEKVINTLKDFITTL